MTSDEHCMLLGKLVNNLIALETVLRAYIGNSGIIPWKPINLDTISIGDYVAVDAFTSYHQLRGLIQLYNNRLEANDRQSFLIDEAVVDLRDAIAHGRALAGTPSLPVTLYKFDKPENGQTKVTHRIEMTENWFKENIKLVRNQAEKVLQAGKAL